MIAISCRATVAVLLAAIGISACTSSRPVGQDEYNIPGLTTGSGIGSSISGDQGVTLFSNAKTQNPNDLGTGGGGIGVNAYLWRGALDTLAFMPLAQADPFGGVIITDWYTPPATSGERFKATAYILGRQLRADGVKVSIFRQVQKGNQWIDAPVAPATTSEIENKVLARARELRAQSAS
jgi:hypothetical protein